MHLRAIRPVPIHYIAVAAILYVAVACSSTETSAPEPTYHLVLGTGDAQLVDTGAFSAPLEVHVLDADDTPVPGVVVTWTVAAGPGGLTANADTTDVDGTASVTFRSFADAGEVTVTAALPDSKALVFSLVVSPAAHSSGRFFFRVDGNGGTLAVNDTSVLLVLEVQDSIHHPIPGLAVTWEMVSGPGSVTPGDTTDVNGRSYGRYFSTADTGTRIVMARIGATDSVKFALQVLLPCLVGQTIAGQTIDSILGGFGPCNHAELSTTFVAGQAYFITETHRPDPSHGGVDFVDPLLTLWRAFDARPVRYDRSRFLAFSDDEGGDLNSELFFVAPESGDFRIVAASFANTGFGGYRLELESCPVIAATATTGTQSYALPQIPAATCLRHYAGGTSGYRFLAFPIAAGEEVAITITSDDFTPVWNASANWEVYNTIEVQSTQVGSGHTQVIRASEAGTLTLAIGGTTPGATGDFTVTLVRTPGGAAAATSRSLPSSTPATRNR